MQHPSSIAFYFWSYIFVTSTENITLATQAIFGKSIQIRINFIHSFIYIRFLMKCNWIPGKCLDFHWGKNKLIHVVIDSCLTRYQNNKFPHNTIMLNGKKWILFLKAKTYDKKIVCNRHSVTRFCYWVDFSLVIFFSFSLCVCFLFVFVVYLWKCFRRTSGDIRLQIQNDRLQLHCHMCWLLHSSNILFRERILWLFSLSLWFSIGILSYRLSLCDFIASYRLNWPSNAICLLMMKYLLFSDNFDWTKRYLKWKKENWTKIKLPQSLCLVCCNWWNFERLTMYKKPRTWTFWLVFQCICNMMTIIWQYLYVSTIANIHWFLKVFVNNLLTSQRNVCDVIRKCAFNLYIHIWANMDSVPFNWKRHMWNAINRSNFRIKKTTTTALSISNSAA